MRHLQEESRQLTTAIHDHRQPSDVRCTLRESDVPLLNGDPEDLHAVFSLLVSDVGGEFEPHWEAIELERAQDAIELTLRFDMAWGVECVNPTDASALTQRFLQNFEGGQLFAAAYDLTTATYQVTFIAVAENRAGILYIEDED